MFAHEKLVGETIRAFSKTNRRILFINEIVCEIEEAEENPTPWENALANIWSFSTSFNEGNRLASTQSAKKRIRWNSNLDPKIALEADSIIGNLSPIEFEKFCAYSLRTIHPSSKAIRPEGGQDGGLDFAIGPIPMALLSPGAVNLVQEISCFGQAKRTRISITDLESEFHKYEKCIEGSNKLALKLGREQRVGQIPTIFILVTSSIPSAPVVQWFESRTHCHLLDRIEILHLFCAQASADGLTLAKAENIATNSSACEEGIIIADG